MDIDELIDELHTLGENELGKEWQRAFNALNRDLMIWAELPKEEREFLIQRACYLVNEGNRILRSL
jgi:hypothetical protein